MRWLVTGGEGFIGSRLLEQVDGDSWDDLVTPKLKGYDIVAHLGALAGIRACSDDPLQAFEWNCMSTFAILNQAREHGCKVVFASSAAAANPTNPYAASKAAMEAWCQAYRHSYGMHISILRFGNVYGPGSWHKTSCVAQMCKDALETGVIGVHGLGLQVRDFVYIDDIITAIMNRPDGLFGVRTKQRCDVLSLAQMIAELSGAEIGHIPSMPMGELDPQDEAPWLEMDYTPLEEGLERTWEWFKAEWQSREEED